MILYSGNTGLLTYLPQDYGDEYQIIYHNLAFNADGTVAEGYEMRIDAEGRLYFSDGHYSYYDVSLRMDPGTGGVARPGDDFTLQFAVANEPQITGIAENDFFAVYDKILIDRAKEYCNNQSITDWTRFSDGFEVTDAVAYGWGGTDDTDTFNSKMSAQQASITAYFADGQSATIAPNPAPSTHRDWSPWQDTGAPESDWSNYMFTGSIDTDTIYDPLYIESTEYLPYRPGFSTYRYMIGSYHWQHVLYSAGVDCSGYLQRVAGYSGNNVTAPQTPRLYMEARMSF